jgi:hypothetical protein
MDVDEAAAHPRLTRDALYKRCRRGEIPTHQDGQGARLWFHRDEVDEARRSLVR